MYKVHTFNIVNIQIYIVEQILLLWYNAPSKVYHYYSHFVLDTFILKCNLEQIIFVCYL